MTNLIILAIALPTCAYLGMVLGEALMNLNLKPWENAE